MAEELEAHETQVEIQWAVPPWLTCDDIEWPQEAKDIWMQGYEFALVNYGDPPVQADAAKFRAVQPEARAND